MPEDLLLRDNCKESIKSFWAKSGRNPAKDYYPDPDGESGTRCWICGWKSTAKNKMAGLRTHIRRAQHKWSRQRAHTMAKRDVRRKKADELQDMLDEHVYWGSARVQNCWRFQYLGSFFLANGDQMADIRARTCLLYTSDAADE